MSNTPTPASPAGGRPPRFVPHRCGHCGMTRKTLNGAWLRWKREQSGVGLRELARLSKLSPAFLSDIERGNRHATPRAEEAYRRLALFAVRANA